MNNHWHEQIQRFVKGESSAEGAATLSQALNEDAELRALYLDYVNLDVALGAAAENARITGNEIDRMAAFPQTAAWTSSQSWRWIAAAAACAALVAFLILSRSRDAAPVRPDIAATIASTKIAIARMSLEPAPTFSSWTSPTASLLDQPGLPQGRTRESGN